jgi:hypothetical protein
MGFGRRVDADRAVSGVASARLRRCVPPPRAGSKDVVCRSITTSLEDIVP